MNNFVIPENKSWWITFRIGLGKFWISAWIKLSVIKQVIQWTKTFWREIKNPDWMENQKI